MTELLKIDAIYVAQLIGFDLVQDWDRLPAGFRINFTNAANAGAFEGAESIGEMKSAYCKFICGEAA